MQSAGEVPMAGRRSQPRGGSRKGCPNKVSKTIKVEVLEAFRMVGGRHYLVQQAEKNPAAFLGLLAKLLPHQLQSDLDGVKVIVQPLVAPAEPVRGVLNSPVAEHVWREPAPQLLESASIDAAAAID